MSELNEWCIDMINYNKLYFSAIVLFLQSSPTITADQFLSIFKDRNKVILRKIAYNFVYIQTPNFALSPHSVASAQSLHSEASAHSPHLSVSWYMNGILTWTKHFLSSVREHTKTYLATRSLQTHRISLHLTSWGQYMHSCYGSKLLLQKNQTTALKKSKQALLSMD